MKIKNWNPPHWWVFFYILSVHKKLKKIIYKHLEDQMFKCLVHTYGKEIWVFNETETLWLIILNSDGVLKFNPKFFDKIFNYFSLNQKDYKVIIKDWLEKILNFPVRQVERCSSNLDYLTETILNKKNDKKEWKLNDRFDFSFELVKKFLELKSKYEQVELNAFFIVQNFHHNHKF